ncbi:acyl-CoA carboxylase epsilon subunit [Rathayibacter oskolensis]|nr:acyl-CoA carboxylase epsilon subunit [Rathayibacter oskolensis]
MSAQDSAPDVIISTPGLDARQIAAVTAVVAALASRTSARQEPSQEVTGGWNARSGAVRAALHPAPGAWRSFSL